MFRMLAKLFSCSIEPTVGDRGIPNNGIPMEFYEIVQFFWKKITEFRKIPLNSDKYFRIPPELFFDGIMDTFSPYTRTVSRDLKH